MRSAVAGWMTVLVVGATGNVGRHVVQAALERGARVLALATLRRPGWFDLQGDDQHRLVFLQGDRRHAGNPSDGVIDEPSHPLPGQPAAVRDRSRHPA